MTDTPTMAKIGFFILFGVGWCLPSIIAAARGHRHFWPLFVTNTVGTLVMGIGWVAALVWAVWPGEGRSGVRDGLV